MKIWVYDTGTDANKLCRVAPDDTAQPDNTIAGVDGAGNPLPPDHVNDVYDREAKVWTASGCGDSDWVNFRLALMSSPLYGRCKALSPTPNGKFESAVNAVLISSAQGYNFLFHFFVKDDVWDVSNAERATVDTYTTIFNLKVNALPKRSEITSDLTAEGAVGAPFSYSIAADNSPTSFNATGLPDGLSVNTSTGEISGTPSGAGVVNVVLSASNGNGTGKATLVITINES